MNKYRHELKYLISRNQMLIIKDRLERTMKLDPNVKDGKYLISSLYFDDYDNTCFYDVAAGVDLRKKYRLRFYNHDASVVSLESKAKKKSMMLKDIVRLKKSEVNQLVQGKYLRNFDDNKLKKELTYKMMANGYHPVVVVEYERIPYVYEHGNVRITFDFNVKSSADVKSFIDDYKMCRPVLSDDMLIMEVKYDEYLPSVIYDCINIGNLQQLSISKYALCRRYIVE